MEQFVERQGPLDRITIDNLQTLKVYFDPLRTRIMQEIAHEPRTVHQIAELLGVPFTRLYYHIKMMEKHNLIRVVDVVQLAGAIEEKYYMVTARQYTIDRKLLSFDPVGKNDSLEYMLDGVFGASHRGYPSGCRNRQDRPQPDAAALARAPCPQVSLSLDQLNRRRISSGNLPSCCSSINLATHRPMTPIIPASWRSTRAASPTTKSTTPTKSNQSHL